MSDVDKIKPDWTHRRKVIKLSLVFFGVLLGAITIASFLLALFSKFGFYICIFATVLSACIFATYVCIIGSYVFGSAFETKTFLKTLSAIVPDFSTGKSRDSYNEGGNPYNNDCNENQDDGTTP